MAKQVKQQQYIMGKNGVKAEQNTITDDSFLPSADEILKLNNISTDILPWIMDRTSKEQDARIKFNLSKVELANKNQRNIFIYDILALLISFIIVILFIGVSIFLILKGFTTAGLLFIGSTGLGVVSYFLKKK